MGKYFFLTAVLAIMLTVIFAVYAQAGQVSGFFIVEAPENSNTAGLSDAVQAGHNNSGLGSSGALGGITGAVTADYSNEPSAIERFFSRIASRTASFFRRLF